jgi:hypothetical protein
MFKIGDKVKLKDNPFDEQIADQMILYAFMVTQTMTVTEIKRVFEEGSSGQWIKTDMTPDWIDAFWFKGIE